MNVSQKFAEAIVEEAKASTSTMGAMLNKCNNMYMVNDEPVKVFEDGVVSYFQILEAFNVTQRERDLIIVMSNYTYFYNLLHNDIVFLSTLKSQHSIIKVTQSDVNVLSNILEILQKYGSVQYTFLGELTLTKVKKMIVKVCKLYQLECPEFCSAKKVQVTLVSDAPLDKLFAEKL